MVQPMPASLKWFLSTTGATADSGGAAAASYLMFVQPFVEKLKTREYSDGMNDMVWIEVFFNAPESLSSRTLS